MGQCVFQVVVDEIPDIFNAGSGRKLEAVFGSGLAGLG
jgi:hypothetical protein